MLTVNLLFRWTRVTRGLWERDCGMASTLHVRKTITLMSPNKGKTAVHGCHSTGDMVVRMRKVLAIPWSWYVCILVPRATRLNL